LVELLKDGDDSERDMAGKTLFPSAFQSEWSLYLTLGHERIHVLDYAAGLYIPHNLKSWHETEIRAYGWEIRQTYIDLPVNHFFYNKGVQQPLGPYHLAEYIKHIKYLYNY
ncbi:MAG: hypothetical protein ACOWWR_16495, partial [Eubacteriales bacterium]